MKTNLNIERYRKLLTGRLTKVEHQYVLRRILEERAEIKDLEDRAVDSASSPRLALDQNHGASTRASAISWEERL